jgi:hypothetical protein
MSGIFMSIRINTSQAVTFLGKMKHKWGTYLTYVTVQRNFDTIALMYVTCLFSIQSLRTHVYIAPSGGPAAKPLRNNGAGGRNVARHRQNASGD